jgi:integrase
MALRIRGGKFHYRFELNGREYNGSTHLVASERNRAKAAAIEARARVMAEDRQQPAAKPAVISFTDAAQEFLRWAEAEHRAHPATARRLGGSLTSLTAHFGERQLSSITAGDVEAYKTWRRTAHKVRDVTLRHDLHALSPLLRFARKHGWLVGDPMAEVNTPSDAAAVRFHRVSPEHEALYFQTCLRLRQLDLHDLGRLMLLQGSRPAEVLAARATDLDGVAATWRIPDSKTAAGRRTLHLVHEARSILVARAAGARTPDGWLFPSVRKPGAHLAPLQTEHDAVLRAMGLDPKREGWVLYDWRHNFATRAAARGMPLPTLAAILGHANLRTVQRYIHIGQTDMAEAMERYVAAPALAAEVVSARIQ